MYLTLIYIFWTIRSSMGRRVERDELSSLRGRPIHSAVFCRVLGRLGHNLKLHDPVYDNWGFLGNSRFFLFFWTPAWGAKRQWKTDDADLRKNSMERAWIICLGRPKFQSPVEWTGLLTPFTQFSCRVNGRARKFDERVGQPLRVNGSEHVYISLA